MDNKTGLFSSGHGQPTQASSFLTDDSSTKTLTPYIFVSLRCKAALATLPPELLARIGSNLSLHEYSFLSRTCSRLHQLLFHPAEVVYFLKARYHLSIESGSIVIFAYLANMQARAPLVLERIFNDFFADSPLHLQEEKQRKLQRQAQRQRLNQNTYELNQAMTKGAGSNCDINYGSRSVAIQRTDSLEIHKDAEKARRQAKWEAIRMLGVLYALDKTHVGPSSSSNALVLCGATDAVEQASPSPSGTPSPPLPPLVHGVSIPSIPQGSSSPTVSSLSPRRARCRSRQLSRSLRMESSSGPCGVARHRECSPSLERHDLRSKSWPIPLDTDPICYYRHRRVMRKRQTDSSDSVSASSDSSSTKQLGSNSWPSLHPIVRSSTYASRSSSSNPVDFSRATPCRRLAAQEAAERLYLSPESDVESSKVREHGSNRAIPARSSENHIHTGMTNHTRRIVYRQSAQNDRPNWNREQGNAMMNTEQFPLYLVESDVAMVDATEADTQLESKLASSVGCDNNFYYDYGSHNDRKIESPAGGYSPRRRALSIGSPETPRPRHGTLTKSFSENGNGSSIRNNDSISSSCRLHQTKDMIVLESAPFVPYPYSSRSSMPFPSSVSSLESPEAVLAEALSVPIMSPQNRLYQMPNRLDKIAFLTKYTDRMHLKLQALGIKDWGQADIQRKKTYQLMIQHNDKTGEKDLVDFYLGRYGGSVQLDREDAEQQTVAATAAG